MSTITDFQEAIERAVARVGPAVVGFGAGWGRGSGLVVAPGRILTTAHNLRSEEVTVTFPDGRRESGRVTGVDHDLDVAAVAAETGEVEPVAWDPAGPAPGIGTAVIAFGNPGGRGLRATPGFVSAAGAGDTRARGVARSPAASSTPLPSRAGPAAGRSSTWTGACSGSTRCGSTAA